MKTRIIPTAIIIALAASLTACSVKMAVPGFEYPAYTPDSKWPELAPTADLEKAGDVDVEATLEEVERLKKLAN
ncbi:MAG: hypothetical protein JKX71_07335 [Amylibacter sp.]|nr:hypothetical protein [Amylibacter sp.]